jgi:hypothetical protein
LIGGLVCAVAGGVLWWRQQHPQPHCSVSQDGSRTREYTMCTDKQKYEFGEPIHITFTIKYISRGTGLQKYSSMEFGNGTGPAMDICDPWQHACWSDERTLTEEDKHFMLKLRESRTLTWTWPTTTEHFDYIVERVAVTYDSTHCVANALAGCEASTTRLECISGPWIVYGECSGWGR